MCNISVIFLEVFLCFTFSDFFVNLVRVYSLVCVHCAVHIVYNVTELSRSVSG